MTRSALPVEDEQTAEALTRLALACFLSDLGVDAWCKMPALSRRSFAESHGISLDVLPAVNHAIARYVLDEAQLQRAHRNAALNQLFATSNAGLLEVDS